MTDNHTSPELSALDPTPTASETAPLAAAPPMPPRPHSPQQQAKTTLKEAFPAVDDNVIEAVLIASGGNIEPAFNALLGMTDPSYKPDSADALARHTSPAEATPAFTTSTPLTQLEQDEQLARQLAGEGRYTRQDRRPSRDRPRRQQNPNQQQGQQGKERSFIDDDLPIIRDNIKQGWSQLMGKVKSKLNGEQDQPPAQPPRPGDYNYHQQSSRYDADPRVLGDDFSHLNLRDNSQGQSSRPLANPNLFKSARFSNTEYTDQSPPMKPPRPEQTPNYSAPSQPPPSTQGPSPNKKWEPLRPAEDRDPFAVGDSDDEEGKEDLYGTAPQKATASVGIQESGVVATPLDPAVTDNGSKPS